MLIIGETRCGVKGGIWYNCLNFSVNLKKKYSCPCLSSLKFSFCTLHYVNHVSILGPRFLLFCDSPYGLRALSWDISFLLRWREREWRMTEWEVSLGRSRSSVHFPGHPSSHVTTHTCKGGWDM